MGAIHEMLGEVLTEDVLSSTDSTSSGYLIYLVST